MIENFDSLTKEQLLDFTWCDVFIVFVKNKKEAKKVQQKFNRMGFNHSTKNWINDKHECYYIAQILISKDFRNGRRQQVWGRSEVEKSEYFKHSLISYEKFMEI